MKVAKLVEKGRMEVLDEPTPRVRLGKVLVRVEAAGICGSDLHYFTHGGLGSHPAALPMSLGHEASGTVVGSMCGSLFEEGDRVAIEPSLSCGQCDYCLRGLTNLCAKMEFIGGNAPGALSEFLLLESRPAAMPMSLGHEASGTVVGSMYGSGFEEGDRVAIEPALCCGQCYYCRYGLPNLCPKTEFIGANSSGAFSEFLLVDERQLVKIDLVVSFEQAAMLEPFGVALHAVRLAGLEPGQSVAVFGAGPIGLSLVMAAQLSGAAQVYVIDPIEHRCNVAVNQFNADGDIPSGATSDIQFRWHATQRARVLRLRTTGRQGGAGGHPDVRLSPLQSPRREDERTHHLQCAQVAAHA